VNVFADTRVRLSIIVGAAIVCEVAVFSAMARLPMVGWIAAIGAGAGIFALAAFAVSRVLAPLSRLSDQLTLAANETAVLAAYAKAQNSLDANINHLRTALFGEGAPRRSGSELYFGDRLINGDVEFVDRVKRQFGGTATIFLGEERISTNVASADGSRATGTQMSPGPVRDRVFLEGKTFRGETSILGEAYLAIYEPILSDGAVIGALYVGVKKSDFDLKVETRAGPRAGVLERMDQALALLAEAIRERRETDHFSQTHWLDADDARKAHEAAQQASAADQRLIVEALSEASKRLSAGKLNQLIQEAFPEGSTQLKLDFNTAIVSLSTAIAHIADSAASIHTNAVEIANATEDLSRRTEHQAATLEQTAAAMGEITARVEKTAEGAKEARECVGAMKAETDQSSAVVRQAVAAMDDIQESAGRITHIIGMIDEIAFQTNLLALNAGVEAARAGDAGRGFAVVASEVRALAQRSAGAAHQIKALISASTETVSKGVGFVGETGRALGRIAAQVGDAHGIISEIADFAKEQALALEQVSVAISDLDQVTQQNAAMVEQSTAASRSLAHEAQVLTGLAANFEVAAPAPMAESRNWAHPPASVQAPRRVKARA